MHLSHRLDKSDIITENIDTPSEISKHIAPNSCVCLKKYYG